MSYLLYHRIGSAKHRLVAVTASAAFPLEYIEEHLRAARLRSVIVNSRTAMTLVWRSLAEVALCDDDARLLTKAIDNVLTPDDEKIVAISSDEASQQPMSPCLSFNPQVVPVSPEESQQRVTCTKRQRHSGTSSSTSFDDGIDPNKLEF